MNYSAIDLTLDDKRQNSLYSKNNFQNEDDNDQIVHKIPQASFEGVHGINEDYKDEFDHDEQEEQFIQEFDQDQEVAYFPNQQQLEDNQDEHDSDDNNDNLQVINYIYIII